MNTTAYLLEGTGTMEKLWVCCSRWPEEASGSKLSRTCIETRRRYFLPDVLADEHTLP
jgi:hypothetical protein